MKKQDILFLLWSGLIIVLAWVAFSILHAISQTTISTETTQQIASIKPNFDTKTIDLLKKRNEIPTLYNLAGATASTAATPTPTPISLPGLIIPIATGSSSLSTSGGQLQ